MADGSILKEWGRWYKDRGISVAFVDSIKGTGMNQLKSMLKSSVAGKLERDKLKGRI